MSELITVGILNITDDSFSDGGKHNSPQAAIDHAAELTRQRFDLIDIGAESTNPQSSPLTADQEAQRLAPVIPDLIKQYGPDRFSVDSYHPETIAWTIEQGMRPIVNDVSGLHDIAMAELVLKHNLTVIISHLPRGAKGVPTRAHTTLLLDDIKPVKRDLLTTAASLEARGLPRNHIILDPGIGFGKTMRLNWQLLSFPALVPEYAVMLGYSRKRFLHTDPQTGEEISELIALKQAGGATYESWLDQIHTRIQNQLSATPRPTNQTIYLRLHRNIA